MTRERAEQDVSSRLESGERALWYGVPPQGLMLRGSDALAIPFSIMWGGFAIFWEASVLNTKAPAFFALWGVPFVLAGLYMMVGRFFVDAQQRTRTAYAVTDRRILILSGLFSTTVQSLSLKSLADVSLTEKANGTGTITFGPQGPMAQRYGRSSWPGMRANASPCFEGIPDAKDVYATIRRAQSAA